MENQDRRAPRERDVRSGGLSNFQLAIGDALTRSDQHAHGIAVGAANHAGPRAWSDERALPARSKPFADVPTPRAYWERRLLGATLKHTVSHSSRSHPRFWFAGHQEILIELQTDHRFEWNELTHAGTPFEQMHMLEPQRARRYGSWSVEGQAYAAELILHVRSDDKLLRGRLDTAANEAVIIDQRRYEIY